MKKFKLGIDIGSTTAKLALINESEDLIFSEYLRHNTRIIETLLNLLNGLYNDFGNISLSHAFSGSTAMGIAESIESHFIQEIVAAASLVLKKYSGTKSLIDIGGEDAKLVLFNDLRDPDIRMNGNCAGGTGAYIDQMAALLDVSISELNNLAWQSSKIYPIASRCGVFAKTDIQNLISRKINTADIAASIFEAVANQTINSLARGCSINPDILFCGGPLTYISYLREVFSRLLKIDKSAIIVPERAELFTALGCALSVPDDQKPEELNEIINKVKAIKPINTGNNTLQPLFENRIDFKSWQNKRHFITLDKSEFKDCENCFLGIDSGSTTSKVVILNSKGQLIYSFYSNNNGRPLETVVEGLREVGFELKQKEININIVGSVVTGYGEELIKSALNIDEGIVETVAHFLAAQKIEPEVSFILDIGGQDIKAIFVQNNSISNIEINEACSSGCGSFIEGFAGTLGYSTDDFACLATQSEAPYDLGSRCTVFMNSKVKQALREGATINDLSAGLAYSVIKNCLYKVLRIKRNSSIGDNIVVQGGTFKNDAVFRCLEILSGKKIVISDMPELMGVYGAALYALNKYQSKGRLSSFIGFQNLENAATYNTRLTVCKGCTNNCQLTIYKFPHGSICYSGNKCEKIFSNKKTSLSPGTNIFDFKQEALFSRNSESSYNPEKINIGIPRVLNIYENYPFWHSLFTNCGFNVILSDESNHKLYQKGVGSLMSDNICFPAKLSHGHIINLIEHKVDRIFLPLVVFEKKEYKETVNNFNCPIVTGYPEVLKNTTILSEASNIPFDSPAINFNNIALLKKACLKYFKQLGCDKKTFNKAFKEALLCQRKFKLDLRQKNLDIFNKAVKNNELVVLVAGHPYHIDHLIHQKVSQILSDAGVNVINEDITYKDRDEGFSSFQIISQWEYPNRILHAAWWASRQTNAPGFVQLNSFGCGLDTVLMDEISDLAGNTDLCYALLRIDDISSPGPIRLRLRSLIESLKIKAERELQNKNQLCVNNQTAVFGKADKDKTILVPWFSDFYSPIIPSLGKLAGYKLENLPPSDKDSVEMGLEYANNEICYPATLVVGDIIKALKSNKYDLNKIAIGMTQTGGQCRATNYLALIKRAMVNEGFENVPVISVSAGNISNKQPGFRPNWVKLIKPAFLSLLFADSLSAMYHSTAAREIEDGASENLKLLYIDKAKKMLEDGNSDQLLTLLNQAIGEFNSLPIISEEIQTVALVGEIYVKYNAYGQFYIIDWLLENNIEVIVPPLAGFFMQAFVNSKVQVDEYIKEHSPVNYLKSVFELVANHYIDKFEKLMETFKFYRPSHKISHSAKIAEKILNLNNQYGEGWLLPAEIASFAEQNINNIICIQPFGCIANHIVGKGMEMKIKDLYPWVNMLFLDFDSGVTKVNILNRLHFLVQNIEKSTSNV